MSDKPTQALLDAIKGYDTAFGTDKRFSRVRSALAAVSEEAQRLDPIADRDEQVGSQAGREAPVTAQKGAPEARVRLDTEEKRHQNDEGQNDPPLKRAAKQEREIFRTARAQDAQASEAADGGK